jgi:hypothetical protein
MGRPQGVRAQQEVVSKGVDVGAEDGVGEGEGAGELVVRFVEVDEPDVLERLLGGQSITAFPQQSAHQIAGGFAVAVLGMLAETELSPHDVGDGFAVVLGFEWSHTLHQLEHRDPQRPQIHSLVISTPLEHLRRTIIRRARERQQLLLASTMHKFLTDAEIDNFDAVFVLVEENVLGFDVAVADI